MFVALAISALEKLSQSPELLKKFSLPNINFPTMGGEVMWNNIAKYNGWRVQQNTITHHCRILDPNNVRRAWGSMEAMEGLLRKIADAN